MEELLHKADTFCFTYQHVDCLYNLFKSRFNGKIIAKGGNVLDDLQRAISFNQRNRGVDKMPRIAKKRLSRKIFSVVSKRLNQRGPVVQCLQREFKKLKRLNFNWN